MIDIILQLSLTVGLIHKERDEGTNHTQLTVRFKTYTEICCYQNPTHSAPYLYRRLLMIDLHYVYCIKEKNNKR